jgi:holo-[acyl-carrier protein] synthase
MIFGIGTDICSIERIKAAHKRRGYAFVQRILTTEECKQWQCRADQNQTRSFEYLASRFCAKEAIGKALGLGIRYPMAWHSCTIISSQEHLGKPQIMLHEPLANWCQQRNLHILLSLSDEHTHTLAFCIVQQNHSQE